MALFRTKENAQRKYIDIIKEAAAKWPNWDPARSIRVGDFGTVNRKSGELSVEGNIYDHASTKHVAQQYPAVEAPDVDFYQIPSYEVRQVDPRTDPGKDDATDQDAVFKSQWQFNAKRGAVLLMHKPRLTRLPDAFFKTSQTLNISILKGKFVVYQAWNCPGFYMYLSNRTSEHVTIGLRPNVPNPAAPSTDTQPAPAFSWYAEGSAGVRQHAYRADPVYTPLFCMKKIRRPLLRRDEKGQGPEAWFEADVPWEDLDEEGVTEPEPVFDDGPDDDSDDD